MTTKFLLAAMALSLLQGPAITAPAGIAVSDKGILVDSEGVTLYVYDNDAPNTSSCYGQCATFWPPLIANDSSKETGEFSIVERRNGERQWAYKGRPLYLWVGDLEPGDTTGDGIDDAWHVVK